MTISIMIADDHAMFRQGLKLLLENTPDFRVIGQSADGLETLALAEKLHPDLLVVDMMMPGLNGIEVIKQVRQRLPAIRIIVLSMSDEEGYVVRALQNGAVGYVLKESSGEDMVNAIKIVMGGERYLSPKLSERALKVYLSQSQPIETDYDCLTNREHEVLQLSAEGLSGPEIARRLSVSPRTVETHRANLMRKLGLRSQTELVNYARREKIIRD